VVTTLAVFTRDLRVHDNPVLAAAAHEAEHVVPVFVRDTRSPTVATTETGRSLFASGDRQRFLDESLADLDESLRNLGGRLVLRSGDPVEQICQLADEAGAARVHIAADSSAYAQRRQEALGKAVGERGRELRCHDEVHAVIAPGRLTPADRDHFAVFTPYYRRWVDTPRRRVLSPPGRLSLPDLDLGASPTDGRDAGGRTGRDRGDGGDGEGGGFVGGESAGRRRAERWLGESAPDRVHGYRDGVHGYDDSQDRLAEDGTSRLSPYLHLGCVSALELVTRAGASDGALTFVRQLAWRDFYQQLLAARLAVAWADYRPGRREWRTDPAAREALEAWRTGRTGIPIVDAGMRQLHAEGWLHNRARLITGSFLTKTLGIDWRAGAAHYLEHLVDGDLANNNLNWQWIAGTGTDTRPNRVLNPLRQAERYDPDGTYVRRHVPELAHLPGPAVHRPWRLPEGERQALDYPPPIMNPDDGFGRVRL